MKGFRDLNFNVRLNIALGVLLTILFLIIGLFQYRSAHKLRTAETEKMIQKELEEISYIIEEHQEHYIEKKSMANQVINYYSENLSSLMLIDSSYIQIEKFIDTAKVRRYFNLDVKHDEDIELIFTEKKYFKSGFTYLINSKGVVLEHPTSVGKDLSDVLYIQQVLSSDKREGHFEYKYPSTRRGIERILYYKYIPVQNAFLIISFPKEEMYAGMSHIYWELLIIY